MTGPRWLAWTAFALTTALSIVALFVGNTPARLQSGLGLLFGAVGALIAVRRRENLIGWLLTSVGLLNTLAAGSAGYAIYLYRNEQNSSLADFLTWFFSWLWVPGFCLIVIALVLFPNGRLHSPAWRWVIWAGVIGLVIYSGAEAWVHWPLRGPGLFDLQHPEPDWAPLTYIPLFFAMIGAVGAVVSRTRQSKGLERVQMKWLGYGGAISLIGVLATSTPLIVIMPFLAIAAIPLAIGIAVLRYRLYEIDRLISRTVTYVLLTGMLALVFFGGVVLLRPLLGPVASDSDLGVAGSTLAVAALFGPARRRIQAAVDRRFNRARYNAAQVVDALSTRLQGQVDLDQLRAELLTATRLTVQPAGASIWLQN